MTLEDLTYDKGIYNSVKISVYYLIKSFPTAFFSSSFY